MTPKVDWKVLAGALVICALASSAFGEGLPQQAGGDENASTQPKASIESSSRERDNGSDKLDYQPGSDSSPYSRRLASLAKDFAEDQKQIWTSPSHLRLSDAEWIVPLGGFTSGLFFTDRDFSKHLSQNPSTISHYKTVSDAGLAALVGGAGGMWLLGHVSHNEHWSETGFLAGESALNSLVLVEGMKYSLRRERPFQGDGSGAFFQSGGTSFPSEHAAAAWSAAGVIAHEYPGPLTKLAAYGLASLVSVSRVKARQHFPSDVLIGSMMGNLIAQDIYSRRHDPELGGDPWRSVSQFFRDASHSESRGSPYVPLDSWVYPALERLSAMRLVDSAFLGMKPWTRLECARLADEAAERVSDQPANSTIEDLVSALQQEFAAESARPPAASSNVAESGFDSSSEREARVESIYTRVTGISGTPLNDSYHFGQTIINDSGRPYQEGFNNYTGFSAYAVADRFTIYVNGEYQHAPSAAGFPQPILNFIASVDKTPVQTAAPVPATDQFRLLDTYVAANVADWDLAFGKQSLWWGPTKGGALLFSDNAEPIYMFRASRIAPFRLPWIFGWLGPMKLDLFFGQLAGNNYPPRPLIHGEKISFKPTKNLEFGFSRTAEFGGVGRALTLGALYHSYFGFQSSFNYPASRNPGERNGGFDFSYALPGLRDWLVVYGDTASRDDPSPLDAPRRAALNMGLYVPRFPLLRKLDFRIEAVNTNPPTSRSTAGQFYYYEAFYRDLYTNKNHIFGDWIGREGQGVQAWSTYWFTSRSSFQFGYRHAKVASDFIPGGETLNDGSAKLDWWLRGDLSVSSYLQYEKWLAPLLAPVPQTNWTSSVGITFWPKSWSK